MEQIILIGIFGFLFYLFNELEDESVRGNWKKHKQFLNTPISWKNKWKLDDNGGLIPAKKRWYYFGITPSHKERFPFSSTVLVFVTDGEHLFQFLKFRMLDVAFWVVGWRFMLAFEIGKLLSSFTKEKFLKTIQ